MQSDTSSEVKFEAPGPGSWELETAHTHRPGSRYSTELFIEGLKAGFSEGAARYGLMIETMRPVSIHGFLYSQLVPFGAPAGATGAPPPLFLMKLMTRLHPGIRRRLNVSKQALEGKRWREDLRYWDEVEKPAAIHAHLALQAVEPTTLPTAELEKHLVACRDHLVAMARLHHLYNVAHILPVGDFLIHAQRWTGKSAGELARLFKGDSPLSAQLATQETPALIQALRADAAARELLFSNTPAKQVLEQLTAMPGAVGEQMRTYLEWVGYRSLGYDLSDQYALEVPEALVNGIRGAVTGRTRTEGASDTRLLEQVREAVPEAHRQQFDELFAEARLVYRLRDERNTYSDGWALGLTRRAVLAVGARLKELGRLTDAELAIDASHDELLGLLRAANHPTSEELQKRAQWRKTKTHADVPPWLGAPPSPPPPMDFLPPAALRVNNAIMFYMQGVFDTPPAQTTETSVRGLPVSPGIYEGIARIVKEQTDLGRIQKGDVLVAATTSPYFNVVLPLLGAIVTDRGGQLCHAAIVTREYGIPGIVGTREATKVVRDGARVRVNGTTGELQVLS